MMAAMVEVFCDSFEQVPRRIVLDIDDTEDRVHGGQQLALFNAYGACPRARQSRDPWDVDRRPAGADAANDMAQHQRHLGPVRRLARAQDDRHRLAGGGFIDVDPPEAAAVVTILVEPCSRRGEALAIRRELSIWRQSRRAEGLGWRPVDHERDIDVVVGELHEIKLAEAIAKFAGKIGGVLGANPE